ncbi:hypothetical protein GIB67_031905 [Kingdonia uniflora]|uniref:SET domain-containing protein n=1 Tax=Kingdonia uniflora TaxID=39325 RepID=A0A7J7NTH0_9MAGN|nr:hypothetical protein GIB67_031905 [Kingdonia uniflora]
MPLPTNISRLISTRKLYRHHHFNFLSFTTTNTDLEKPSPPPIQVQLTESSGRGVFATRTIKPGELIHTAKPLLTHPSPSPSPSLTHQNHNKICYFCLRKLKLGQKLAISHSPTVSFCSDECANRSKGFYEVEKRVDWSEYNDYCRQRGFKYPLLVKRMACMVISEETSSDSLDILQPASLLPEMISEMEEEFGLLKSTLRGAIKDEQMTFLTKDWYAGILARIRINAFRVEVVGGSYEDLLLSAAASVEAEAAVGNAVYMLPSFYNHDCDPNVHILWIENADARLVAIHEIEAGEELRICYIDTSIAHGTRQQLLLQGFGFKCNCARCISGD